MGILSALGGLGMGQGGSTAMLGLLPMLLNNKPGQGIDPKPGGPMAVNSSELGGPKWLHQGASALSGPMFQNGLQMMATGEAPSFGGMQGAFANSPQFQQQLGAMMNGQGPGRAPPTFTPPPMPMSTSAPATTRGPLGGRPNGNPLANYGSTLGDPMQGILQRFWPQSF
jgi:hypothetical protein